MTQPKDIVVESLPVADATQYSDFARAVIVRMAAACGISYSRLRQERFDIRRREAINAYLYWQRYSNVVHEAWWKHAQIEFICGHNPQRLLEDQTDGENRHSD